MLRLSFVLILIVAAAAAKHVNTKRDHEEDRLTCNGKNHPLVLCSVHRNSNYPVLNRLNNARGYEQEKQILQSDGALESLCGEGKRYLECVDSAMKRSPDKCKAAYERRRLTVENIGKFTGVLEEVCTDDLIARATQNIECFTDEDVITRVARCGYENPDKNCSHLSWDYSESGDNSAIHQCYDERYRRNCNASSILECAVGRVTSHCGRDAGSLARTAGNAIIKRLEDMLCPENNFKRLLKLFKK